MNITTFDVPSALVADTSETPAEVGYCAGHGGTEFAHAGISVVGAVKMRLVPFEEGLGAT